MGRVCGAVMNHETDMQRSSRRRRRASVSAAGCTPEKESLQSSHDTPSAMCGIWMMGKRAIVEAILIVVCRPCPPEGAATSAR